MQSFKIHRNQLQKYLNYATFDRMPEKKNVSYVLGVRIHPKHMRTAYDKKASIIQKILCTTV